MADFAQYQALIVAGGLALAALLLLAVFRRGGAGLATLEASWRERLTQVEAERENLRSELAKAREDLRGMTTERDAALDRLAEAQQTRAAEAEKAEQRLDAFRDEAAHAKAELKRELEGKLQAAQARLDEAQEHGRQLSARISGLTADLKAQSEKNAALKEETEAMRAQMVNQFRAISAEMLDSQRKQTAAFQKGELEKVIGPFQTEISGLKTNIKEMNEKAEAERARLGSQIGLMQAKAAELAQEANTLARALRGEKKRQGNWGETILERILEAAGLQEGTHFRRQASMTDEDGNRLIPDIVVHLPNNRDVVIDSKATLNAYQDMIEAEDKATEEAALRRHVTAVRNHINSLSGKSYASLSKNGMESVMMFLPVEGALTAALSQDPNLIIEAAEKRVNIVTPTTLMPILRIVDHLWVIEKRTRSVDDIVQRAGALHDKFVSVAANFEKVGELLFKARETHDKAMGQLTHGHGNVVRQVQLLADMGAKTKKALPEALLERALQEDEAGAPGAAAEPEETAGETAGEAHKTGETGEAEDGRPGGALAIGAAAQAPAE